MNFSQNPGLQADQTVDYQVDGTVAAVYLTHHCVGPAPISPFVILAASIESIKDFIFDLDFAKAIIPDQDTMDRVEEVFNFRRQDMLNYGNATQARLIELGLQVGAKVSPFRILGESNHLIPSSCIH